MEIISIKLGDIRTNAYIVVNNNSECFIVDPGFESSSIIDYLKSKKIEPQFIYITHGHHDHTGGVKQLKELYHIPVYAPLLDKVWLKDPNYNYWPFEIPVDQFVVDGDIIEFDNKEFKVIETPGHSEGSTALYYPPYLFSGDTLFFESVGRTDIPFSNFEDLKNTILNKLYKLPNNTIVYPGHGKETSIGYEKENNPIINQNTK